MKFIYSILCICLFLIGCQPKPDNAVNEAFDKNAETVRAILDGFQNESLEYNNYYAENAVIRGTSFGDKDSLSVSDNVARDKRNWAMFNFKLLGDSLNLLPGVNVDSKLADGSVRYYGDWEVTLPGTDSTEARSGVVKLYQSFDFNDDGKVMYQQAYGDFGGLVKYLSSNPATDMEDSDE